MIVGKPCVNVFVEKATLTEVILADQTRFDEQFQIPVHGGARDSMTALVERHQDRVGVDVTMLREDLFTDREAFVGHPQSPPADEVAKAVDVARGVEGGGLGNHGGAQGVRRDLKKRPILDQISPVRQTGAKCGRVLA